MDVFTIRLNLVLLALICGGCVYGVVATELEGKPPNAALIVALGTCVGALSGFLQPRKEPPRDSDPPSHPPVKS